MAGKISYTSVNNLYKMFKVEEYTYFVALYGPPASYLPTPPNRPQAPYLLYLGNMGPGPSFPLILPENFDDVIEDPMNFANWGCYVFVNEVPSQPEALFDFLISQTIGDSAPAPLKVNENLNPVTLPLFMWVDLSKQRLNWINCQVTKSATAQDVLVGVVNIDIGPALHLWDQGTNISSKFPAPQFDSTADGLVTTSSNDFLTIGYENLGFNETTNTYKQGVSGAEPLGAMSITLTGPQSGTLSVHRTPLQLSGLSYNLGLELRGCYGPDSDNVQVARYPVVSQFGLGTLDFFSTLVGLDPFDPGKGRFILDPAFIVSQNKLSFFSTVGGQPVTLKPKLDGAEQPPGFAFNKSIVTAMVSVTGLDEQAKPVTDPKLFQQPDYYLTPTGDWEILAPEGTQEGDPIDLLCGPTGTEYLVVHSGDLIRFVPGQPAFVETTTTKRGVAYALPTDTYTTAWVQIITKSGNPTVQYYAQPGGDPHFAKAGSGYSYPQAASVFVGNLASPSPVFPLFPLGGVYLIQDYPVPRLNALDYKYSQQVPNPWAGPAQLQSLETQAWGAMRRQILTQAAADKTHGIIFHSIQKQPLTDATRTPMGFVARLNDGTSAHALRMHATRPLDEVPTQTAPPAGTLKSLLLAKSPNTTVTPQQLTIDPPTGAQVVDPRLSTALANDSLFLVVTDPNALGWATPPDLPFGDFTFKFDVGGDQDKQAIILFKFVRGQSVQDLVDAWEKGKKTPSSLLAASDTLAQALTRINASLTAANKNSGAFADFLKVVQDANWTGILVFNCPLNYDALPADILMLLGGMKSNLMAHHFGIAVNRTETDFASDVPLHSSSLFAVIFYNEAFNAAQAQGKADFQVLLFDAAFANSKLKEFKATIAMSIPELFGCSVALTKAPAGDQTSTNTIVINGTYVKNSDGLTGTLEFDTTDKRTFEYQKANSDDVPVLAHQSVTDAALQPAELSNDKKTVYSSFGLAGDLDFAKLSVMKYADRSIVPMDFFSFGDYDGTNKLVNSGLRLTGHAFKITTDLSQSPPQITAIQEDFSNVKVDATVSSARQDSLAAALSLQPATFNYNEKGMEAVDSEIWEVKVVSDYQGPHRRSPIYTISFKWEMGSLGSLAASGTPTTATIYLGWSPPQLGDTETGVGFFLELPNSSLVVVGQVLETSFDAVYVDKLNLADSTKLFALIFDAFQVELLHVDLMGASPRQLVAFPNPADNSGKGGDVVWYLTESVHTSGDAASSSYLIGLEAPIYIWKSWQLDVPNLMDTRIIESSIQALRGFGNPSADQFASDLKRKASRVSLDARWVLAFDLDISYMEILGLFADALDSSKSHVPAPAAVSGVRIELGKNFPEEELRSFNCEILYRKINDHLGVYSADVTLPGSPFGGGSTKWWMPSIAVSIWTDGGFRVGIGWPLGRWPYTANPLKVQIQAGEFPIEFKFGAYIAVLRGADLPEFGPEYLQIHAFGIGLAGGLGKTGSAGPVSYNASLDIVATVQGFIAATKQDPMAYHWFSFSVGLVGVLQGGVSWKVISASITIRLSLTFMAAMETGHSTVLVLQAQIQVNLVVKLVFVKFHLSFSTTITFHQWSIGSGPAAKLSGPTPPATRSRLMKADGFAQDAPLDNISLILSEIRQALPGIAQNPTSVPLYFTVQVTAKVEENGAVAPQGIACLAISIELDKLPQLVHFIPGGPDVLLSPFGVLAARAIAFLAGTFGGANPQSFAEAMSNVETALSQGQLDGSHVDQFLKGFKFEIQPPPPPPNHGDEPPAVALFPMFPDLTFTYDTHTHTCTDIKAPANYENIIAAYFAGQDLPSPVNPNSVPVAVLVFYGYFEQLMKQVFTTLSQALEGKDHSLNGKTWADLQLLLKDPKTFSQDATQNVAGFLTRSMLGGARLPDPATLTGTVQLQSVYELSGQQFALDAAQLSVDLTGTSAYNVSFAGMAKSVTAKLPVDPKTLVMPGSPSADWTFEPMPPTMPRPRQFPLHASLTWTTTNKRIVSFSHDLQHALELWKAAHSTAPYMQVQQVNGGDGTHVDLSDPASVSVWKTAPALLLPLKLRQVPDPADRSKALTDIYELVGTDEAHRALLQNLLGQLDANTVTGVTLDLVAPTGSGAVGSQPSGKVSAAGDANSLLVKANLSTSTSPGGGGAVGTGSLGAGSNGNCPSSATMSDGKNFLLLVWECSIVHSGGFYLKTTLPSGVNPKNGKFSIFLLVRASAEAAVIEIAGWEKGAGWQNAIVGDGVQGSLVATLATDSSGTTDIEYGPTYPGGSVGWEIVRAKPPADGAIDAASGEFLRELYHLFSSRVTNVGGTTLSTTDAQGRWSLPIHQQNPTTAETSWLYAQHFLTAPLVGQMNRYAEVGQSVGVDIDILDPFGNSLPPGQRDKFLKLTTSNLPVVYNDPILGVQEWPGISVEYAVTPSGGEAVMQLVFGFNPETVRTTEPAQKPLLLQHKTERLELIYDQLTDPNGVTLGVATNLAAAALTKDVDNRDLSKLVAGYVQTIINALDDLARNTAPGPTLTIQLPLQKSYPTQWGGDLQELSVTLSIARTAKANTLPANYSPDVHGAAHSIKAQQPVQTNNKVSSTSLKEFAKDFEAAYNNYDGQNGRLKVASGVQSDPASVLFGSPALWVMRWRESGQTGASVTVTNAPVYYAPTPVSTRLESGTLTDLGQTFSNIDMDLWAKTFLNAVESLFGPAVAPGIVGLSKDDYDALIKEKQALAAVIKQTLDYVYNSASAGNPDLAREVLRQALLRSLVNDYGTSALVQLPAQVTLTGDIEPGGDPGNPPNLYGQINTRGGSTDLPYALSNARLPLKQGETWLNFLVSAKNPAQQAYFDLDLAYQMGFVEHNINGAQARCDYAPSSWLAFLLQQDSPPLGNPNTLTANIGQMHIPVPLRAYPPNPKLVAQSATQTHSTIATISDALVWDYVVNVVRPSAAQDTLVLRVTLNESVTDSTQQALAVGKLQQQTASTSKLFEALARFNSLYSQLAANLPKAGKTNRAGDETAVKQVNALIDDVAKEWSSWTPPGPPPIPAAVSGYVAWEYRLEWPDHQTFQLTRIANSDGEFPPWPALLGYQDPSKATPTKSQDGKSETVSLNLTGAGSNLIQLTWSPLFVMDYQSAKAAAYTERNADLAPPNSALTTNPLFIYRTPMVQFTTPVVPLIQAMESIQVDSGASLSASIQQSMLNQFRTQPSGSQGSGTADKLTLEGHIGYSYQLSGHLQNTVRALIPVSLVLEEDMTEDATAAKNLASDLNNWRQHLSLSGSTPALSFAWTLFATKVVGKGERLPVARFSELRVNVPDQNVAEWWTSAS